MTITVNSATEIVSVNNTTIPASVDFVLTSSMGKEPEVLSATRIEQNDRYSTIEITFPADFKDGHYNGVYYYDIEYDEVLYESGYVKIITEPGGADGAVRYESSIEVEERQAKIYYRPDY